MGFLCTIAQTSKCLKLKIVYYVLFLMPNLVLSFLSTSDFTAMSEFVFLFSLSVNTIIGNVHGVFIQLQRLPDYFVCIIYTNQKLNSMCNSPDKWQERWVWSSYQQIKIRFRKLMFLLCLKFDLILVIRWCTWQLHDKTNTCANHWGYHFVTSNIIHLVLAIVTNKLCNEKSEQIFDLQGVLTHKKPRETCQKGFQ